MRAGGREPGALVMGERRISRRQRRPAVRVRLLPRDQAVLRALAKLRLCRSSDLHRLLFTGVRADTMAKRLRKLFDAGFLDVHAENLAAETVYSLGHRGIDWVTADGMLSAALPRKPWEHHLAIVRIWTEMASLAHVSPGWQLKAFTPEWRLRAIACRSGGPLVPDGVADLVVPSPAGPRAVRFALEVDLGGEAVRVLRKKLRLYTAELLSGSGMLGSDFGLAVAVGGAGEGRVATIQRLLESIWPGRWNCWLLESGCQAATRQLVESAAAPLTSYPNGLGRNGQQREP